MTIELPDWIDNLDTGSVSASAAAADLSDENVSALYVAAAEWSDELDEQAWLVVQCITAGVTPAKLRARRDSVPAHEPVPECRAGLCRRCLNCAALHHHDSSLCVQCTIDGSGRHLPHRPAILAKLDAR